MLFLFTNKPKINYENFLFFFFCYLKFFIAILKNEIIDNAILLVYAEEFIVCNYSALTAALSLEFKDYKYCNYVSFINKNFEKFIFIKFTIFKIFLSQ